MKKLLLLALTALSFAITATAQQFHWAKPGYQYQKVTTDKAGNVYILGYAQGSGVVDVDPGTGVFNVNNNTPPWSVFNYPYVVKLNGQGNFVWGYDLQRETFTTDWRFAVDDIGNVYVVGERYADMMDPGYGGYIRKINSNGTAGWEITLGPVSIMNYTKCADVATDSVGNIYVTGSTSTTIDLDPGTSNVPFGSGTFTVKYTSAGDYVSHFGNGGQLLKVSSDGNSIYIAQLYGYQTSLSSNIIKRDLSGTMIWSRTFDSTTIKEMNISEVGKVYVTGHFTDTVDMDPGAGVSELATAGDHDQFLLKMDTAGTFIWAKQMGSMSVDEGVGVVLDGKGHLYTTGIFSGTVDMDPGTTLNNLVSATPDTTDIFVQKLDTDGNYIWAKPIASNGFEISKGMAVDTAGAIFIIGWANGADLDPGTPVFTLPSSYSFVTKWSDTIVVNSAKTILNAEDNIILYPNPSSRTINVSAEQIIDNISVTDISGRVIFTSSPANERTSVDILTPGIYFISVTSRGNISRGKVLIQ